MTSLLTNTSAMTALQTLTQTNKNMAVTQNRISTGFRVATASDNAAYWSIATTMRSDNKALSTVQDALGLGAAQVDIAYTAMDKAKDLLDEIKIKLVAAKQPGVDKSKIQSELAQFQKQLQGAAAEASFSGSNWLSIDSSSNNYNAVQKVVSSFSRTGDGAISIGTIDVELAGTALFDASATDKGLLEAGLALTDDGGIQDVTTAAGDGSGAAASVELFADVDTAGVTLDDNDAIKFDLVFDGETTTVIINKAIVGAALSTTDGVIADAASMVTVVELALEKAGFDTSTVTVADSSGAVTITHNDDATTSTLAIENSATSNNGNFFGATDIDITNATDAQLNEYISGIDAMFAKVTTAASDLGAVKSRIDLQKDFVSSLRDAISRGVGQLVDADMNAESTRLQALQVQQQLGIQALSIANSNSQNILSLFR